MALNARFATSVAAFVKKARINTDVVLRKVALDGFTGIIKRSPVDTGRFRANWRIGIDHVDASTDSLTSQGKHGTPPTAAELGIALNKIGTAKFGQSIHISNNLPYALRLEHGWSKQAPNGMVSQTFAELVASLKRAVAAL